MEPPGRVVVVVVELKPLSDHFSPPKGGNPGKKKEDTRTTHELRHQTAAL